MDESLYHDHGRHRHWRKLYIQDNVLTKQLQSDSGKIMDTLVKSVSVQDAESVKGSTDRNSDIQKN